LEIYVYNMIPIPKFWESVKKKVAVVTGANRGVGVHVATDLANAGYDVVLACRNIKQGEEVRDKIVSNLKPPQPGEQPQKVVVIPLDLSSKQSVLDFAEKFQKEFQYLDVLVNNAAICTEKKEVSVDGIETMLQTNVLSPYMLTQLLMPSLSRSKSARVVNVASVYAGDLDVKDLQYNKRSWNNDRAYRQSKQANRMISKWFADKFPSNVTSNATTPGMCDTRLLHDLGFSGGRSPAEGAKVLSHLALDPVVEGVTGKYYDSTSGPTTCHFSSQTKLIEELVAECNKLLGMPADWKKF